MSQIKGRILLVTDDKNNAGPIFDWLSAENYQVFHSLNGHAAIDKVNQLNPDAVLLNESSLGLKPIECLRIIKQHYPEIPVLFIGSCTEIEDIVEIMASGAYYYFMEPLDCDKLTQVLYEAVQECPVQDTDPGDGNPRGESRILSHSPKMLPVLRTIRSVANSRSTVLITGETGTGKELVAWELHRRNRDKDKPFVAVNCAAIPRELVEAELFGYEKGAFTGAVARRVGKFEEASEGTLFLDEIGELAVPVQAKLFRALEEKEIERLGSNNKEKLVFRLICATNNNLSEAVRKGWFREELYYRINVVHIHLPPLRERKEDISLLALSFLKEFCEREGKQVDLSRKSLEILTQYHWPGNVRQLRNVIERAVVLAAGNLIFPRDFSKELRELKRPGKEPQSVLPLKVLETQAVLEALTAYQGNISRAARALGISRKSLYKRMRENPEIHMKKLEVKEENGFSGGI